MIRLSFVEKMDMLKDIIMSNAYTFVIFIAFIFIAIILLNTKKLNKDMLITSCIGIYIVMFICVIFEYKDTFYGIIDNLINNIFFNILFPSITTYAVTIIISNIIIIYSILNKKTKSYIRKINILVYCFLSLILFLVLNFIQTNNIDVYSSLSVYSNKELFVLIELNMGIFTIWIISLYIIYFINKKRKQNFVKEPVKMMELNTNMDIVETEIVDSFEKFRKPLEEKIEIEEKKINLSLNDFVKEFQ